MAEKKLPGILHRAASSRFPKGGWEVRYTDDSGMTHRKTWSTQEQALDFQAAVRTDKNRGDYLDERKARTPFKEVAQAWYDGTTHLRPTTRATYQSILKTYILPRLGHYTVGRITPSVLRAFLNGLPEEMSAARKRHVFATLIPIFSMAIDDGMIRTSPTKAKTVLAALPKARNKDMLFLNAAQVEVLANAITPRYRTLVYFAAYTGMRSGEIVALKVGDVDLATGRVKVRGSVSDVNGILHEGPTKNGETRELGIPAFLTAMLEEQIGERRLDRETYVFPGTAGRAFRHANFYERHFKPAVRRALPAELHGLRFHDLRHTCASMMLKNGEHMKAVQQRLGHKSVAITIDRYSHFEKEHESEVVGRFEQTFRAAVGAQPAPDADVRPLRGR